MAVDLFEGLGDAPSLREGLRPGAIVLRRFALPDDHALLSTLEAVVAKAPFRHIITPDGFRMSVALTRPVCDAPEIALQLVAASITFEQPIAHHGLPTTRDQVECLLRRTTDILCHAVSPRTVLETCLDEPILPFDNR